MRKETITKKILKYLLIGGAVFIAASSPAFSYKLSKAFYRSLMKKKHFDGSRSEFNNAFYYLKRRGYLNFQKRNHQVYISLSEEGKKRAGEYQIDDLKIKRYKKWDRKYRIAIFDIPNVARFKRDIFRGKIKQLGFYQLQQSVWVHAFDCWREINLLRDFLGLNKRELKIITGTIEDDGSLREFFKI